MEERPRVHRQRSATKIVESINGRFTDHSRKLPKALGRAHDRTWQAVALAGEGFLNRIKGFFASGDARGVGEQVRLFLTDDAISFDGSSIRNSRRCLDELNRLRESGKLSVRDGSYRAIARQAAGLRRRADQLGLIGDARRAMASGSLDRTVQKSRKRSQSS